MSVKLRSFGSMVYLRHKLWNFCCTERHFEHTKRLYFLDFLLYLQFRKMFGCFESKRSSVLVPKFLWGLKENWTKSHKVTLTHPMKEKLTWTPLEKLWTNGLFLDRHYSWYSLTLFTGLFPLRCNLIYIYFVSPAL